MTGFILILAIINQLISYSQLCKSEDDKLKCFMKYHNNELNISLKIDDKYVKQLSFISKYLNNTKNIQNLTFKNLTDAISKLYS